MTTKTNVLTVEVALEPITCGACGVTFGLPTALLTTYRRTHQTWYCPNGHSRYYPGESDEEKLKKALKEEEARSKQAEYSLYLRNQELAAANKTLATTRGQLTRVRKRVANGVCPDCHRHFENLEKHMKSKHTPEAADATA